MTAICMLKFEDGRIILTPMSWYKELQAATFKQLTNYQFICQGTGIEWIELDYHLSIESMLLSQIKQKAAQLINLDSSCHI